MSELQLNLTMLLPGIDAGDQCIHHLTTRLAGVRGVELAHIINTNGAAELCLHYDPNLVTIARLERLAQETGAQINATFSHETLPFAGNKLTSDPVRYQRNSVMYEKHRELALGGPTARWVHASCVAMDKVLDPDFKARIQIPTLIIAAGADEIVSNAAIERFVRGMRSTALVTVDGGKHELLQEADIYREQVLAAFDAFVPGSDTALD